MRVLYRSGLQTLRVRSFMYLSLLAAVGGTWAGAYIYYNYGPPTSGSVPLGPVEPRVAISAAVVGLGIGIFVAMCIYGSRYVAEIALLPGGDRVQVETLTFWGRSRHEIAVSDFQNKAPQEAHVQGHLAGSSPWLSVAVAGRRRFIIDMQGEIRDEGAFRRLLQGKPTDADRESAPGLD